MKSTALAMLALLIGASAHAKYKTYEECYKKILPIERAELKKMKYGASCNELDGHGDYEGAEKCADDSDIEEKAEQNAENFCKDYFSSSLAPKSKK